MTASRGTNFSPDSVSQPELGIEKRTASPEETVRIGARAREKCPCRLRCSSASVWITPAPLVQLFQDLERMTVGLHEVPRLLHLAVGTDEEGRADHTLAATGPLAPRAVRVVDRAVGVAEQIEIQPVLLLE